MQEIYQTPELIESFSALEVMDAGEGLEVYSIGCGSRTEIICVPA